jgi:hypothetical protein
MPPVITRCEYLPENFLAYDVASGCGAPLASPSRVIVAAQMRDDHPIARRRQQRRDIDIAMDVVGPAVQENDHGTIGGAGFGVADIEDGGIDLLQRPERGVRSRLGRGIAGLRAGEPSVTSSAPVSATAAAPNKRRR